MQPQLPPGPRVPKLVQTIGWWTRTPTYLERLRRRYGSRFTLRLLGLPPAVFLSDPADARELFTAPPDVLQALPPLPKNEDLEYRFVGQHLILLDTRANLIIERASQKKIVIGEGGRRIKQIGIRARREIEKLVGAQVHLELWVKVEPGWTKRPARIKALGYV